MSSREQIEALVGEVLRGYDRIDILINNAGVGLQGDAAVLPEKELRYLFDVNVYGPLWAMQAVIPSMQRRQRGAIANISSILAKAPLPSLGMTGGSSGYTGSKAALHAISLAARMELSADGINVVTVLPGVTRSEFNDQFLVSGGASRPPSAGDATGVARPRGSLMGITPPERVAEAILRGIERNQRQVYVTAKDRLFVLGANALPGLFEWAMIRLRRQRLARGASV
jgi:short-subunit dehydrogenase